jgi:hypothetical protein
MINQLYTKLIASGPGYCLQLTHKSIACVPFTYTLYVVLSFDRTYTSILYRSSLSFQNHFLQGANQAATAQQGSFFLNPRYKSIIIATPLYRCIGQDTLPSLKSCELLTYVLFHCHKLFRIQISTAAHGSRCDDM